METRLNNLYYTYIQLAQQPAVRFHAGEIFSWPSEPAMACPWTKPWPEPTIGIGRWVIQLPAIADGN